MSFLFENRRIRFDEFSKDQFLARKNVKKTTSFTLFWKAEMIRSQPIRIHRKQYKYLEDHFRGTNNYFIQGEVKVMFIHKSNAGFLLQGEQGGHPPQNDFWPPKIFKKTIERTIETIAHCFKNNDLLSSPLKFFSSRKPVMPTILLVHLTVKMQFVDFVMQGLSFATSAL